MTTYASPRGDGPTDFDQDQVEIGKQDGRAYVLPSSMRRMHPDARNVVMDVLKKSHEIQEQLEQLGELVDEAREDHGVSWAVIGWAVGMTGEGARLRWGVVDE